MAFFGNIDFNLLNNGNNPFSFGAQNPIINPEMLNFNVPLVQKQYAAPAQQLTAEGNVPVGGASGETVDNAKGTTVEITSDTKKVEEAKQAEEAKKAEEVKQAEQEKQEQKTFVKTGDSFDERLERYYPEYKNASEERKEELRDKYLTGHFASLKNKSRSEQIKLQIADYKKLLHNTRDGESYRKLSARINILEKQNQVLGAKAATIDQADSELRYQGEIGVASAIHKCDDDNQIELTQLVVNSKNEKAIETGASYSSKLAEINQTNAVKIYQTADIKDDAKKLVDRIIIDQYKDFAISNQVDIHQVMSASKFSETVEYAASNIYKFDKSNQAAAVQVTMDTKNEKAINAANSQYANYDKSAQAAVKEILAAGKDESPLTAVSTSAVNTPVVSEATTLATVASNDSQKVVSVSESETRVNTVTNLLKSNKTGAELVSAVKDLSDLEKISLIRQNSDNLDLIRAIFTNNPSIAVLSEISKIIKNNKEASKAMSRSTEMRAYAGFFNIDVQLAFVDNVKNLNAVDIKMLCPTARARYNERVQEEIGVTNKG